MTDRKANWQGMNWIRRDKRIAILHQSQANLNRIADVGERLIERGREARPVRVHPRSRSVFRLVFLILANESKLTKIEVR